MRFTAIMGERPVRQEAPPEGNTISIEPSACAGDGGVVGVGACDSGGAGKAGDATVVAYSTAANCIGARATAAAGRLTNCCRHV